VVRQFRRDAGDAIRQLDVVQQPRDLPCCQANTLQDQFNVRATHYGIPVVGWSASIRAHHRYLPVPAVGTPAGAINRRTHSRFERSCSPASPTAR
jgi:hypothetical protein